MTRHAEPANDRMANTIALIRFTLRRERVRITIWMLAIVALVGFSAAGVIALFPTQESLDNAAAASENPAIIAFNGPAQGLDTIGGQVAFQIGSFGLSAVALMTILVMARLTRGEEEDGRIELVRSLPVGRDAPLAAAAIVVAAMSAIVGVLVTLSLVVQSLPVRGSIDFGLGYVFVGFVFTALTMVAAQITDNARVAAGIAGCLLGASFLLRALGDIGNGVLSWLSPIGWAQKTRPFAGDHLWPFVVAIGAVVGLGVLAAAMLAHRDEGAGLIAPRPGRARASNALTTPFGLAMRLSRGSIVGWTVGVVVTGVAYGSIVDSIADFVRDNKALADILAGASTAGFRDAYLATSTRIVALLAGGLAVQIVIRLRSEESSNRAEPILAGSVSRDRWVLSQLAVSLLGGVIAVVAAGISIGVSAAISSGQVGDVPRVLVAAIAYLPAVLLLATGALALYAVRPVLMIVAWTFLATCFVLALFGPLLRVPAWVAGLSPFDHIPLLPGGAVHPASLIALVLAAGTLVAGGVLAIRARDIG